MPKLGGRYFLYKDFDHSLYKIYKGNGRNPYMKASAKKRYNLADLGDFEGFVDLYPCRSVHSEISSMPVLLSDAV